MPDHIFLRKFLRPGIILKEIKEPPGRMRVSAGIFLRMVQPLQRLWVTPSALTGETILSSSRLIDHHLTASRGVGTKSQVVVVRVALSRELEPRPLSP